MIPLQQTCQTMQQQKNFENRPTFGLMTKNDIPLFSLSLFVVHLVQ